MIVKFDAQTLHSMIWEVDTTKNPVTINYGGWTLSLEDLQKIVEAATAALEFATETQFSHDYDEAHKND